MLIATCTGVSFTHGSNDGQKGMGLIMLVLIALAPAAFALQLDTPPAHLRAIVEGSRRVEQILHVPGAPALDAATAEQRLDHYADTGRFDADVLPALAMKNDAIVATLSRIGSLRDLTAAERSQLRSDVYLVDVSVDHLMRSNAVGDADAAALDEYRDTLLPLAQYLPLWVKAAVALALGLGTMVGWRRIVTTIGEKIGKTRPVLRPGRDRRAGHDDDHRLRRRVGVPVSTTHMLTSSVAGTMFANRSGLQGDTVRNILIAWVLTVPACVLLGSLLFAGSLFVVLRLFG